MAAVFNEDGTVTITSEEFDELTNDSLFLNCLRSQGVDNWDGYDFAVEEYNQVMASDSD